MYRVVADHAIHAAALSHGDTQAARIFFASVLWSCRSERPLSDFGTSGAGTCHYATMADGRREFGWRSTENYQFDGTKPDTAVTRAIDSSGKSLADAFRSACLLHL